MKKWEKKLDTVSKKQYITSKTEKLVKRWRDYGVKTQCGVD